MENKLLANIKTEMVREVEKLDFKNHETIASELNKYLEAVRSIAYVAHLMPESTEIVKAVAEVAATSHNKSEEQEEKPAKIYKFERRIKGGSLPEIDAFVPERVIRDLDLETGDKLYAEKIEAQPGYTGPTLYTYSLAERRTKDYPVTRIQLNNCIVKYDASIGRYYTEKDINGLTLRLGEMPGGIYLPESDATEMGLKEGDIVDVAYSANDINHVRIAWRYNTEEKQAELTESQAMLAGRAKKDKAQKTYEPTLENKHILMIGFEPGKADIRDEVERRKGSFEWGEGRENDSRLFSMISRADAVIFMLQHMKHTGSIRGVDFCKQLGVPFETMHNFGRSEFISKVEELVQEEDSKTA